MLTVSLSLVLAAAPVSIAVPGVTCVAMDRELCDSFLDRFVATITEGGRVKVVSAKDIAQLLGLERQRALLGCTTESASCLAELSGALGVDAVMTISFTRSDPYFVTSARVLRAKDGAAVATASERVRKEGEVFDSVDTIATKFREQLDSPSTPSTSSVASTSSPSPLLPWVPAASGVVVAAIGLGVFVSADHEKSVLESHPSVDTITSSVEAGRFKQQFGVGLMIAGGAGVAASAVWFIAGRRSEAPSVAVMPVAGGLAVSAGGTFP